MFKVVSNLILAVVVVFTFASPSLAKADGGTRGGGDEMVRTLEWFSCYNNKTQFELWFQCQNELGCDVKKECEKLTDSQ